jgi:hypothetical protein
MVLIHAPPLKFDQGVIFLFENNNNNIGRKLPKPVQHVLVWVLQIGAKRRPLEEEGVLIRHKTVRYECHLLEEKCRWTKTRLGLVLAMERKISQLHGTKSGHAINELVYNSHSCRLGNFLVPVVTNHRCYGDCAL